MRVRVCVCVRARLTLKNHGVGVPSDAAFCDVILVVDGVVANNEAADVSGVRNHRSCPGHPHTVRTHLGEIQVSRGRNGWGSGEISGIKVRERSCIPNSPLFW